MARLKRIFPYKVLASLLLTAFLIQTFSKPFIVADYYVNTAGYAKNCINKLIPMMHCNGKCQMIKKLLEEEKKDQKSSEKKSASKTETFSNKTSFASVLCVKAIFAKKEYAPLLAPKQTDRSFDIFHPPGLAFAS